MFDSEIFAKKIKECRKNIDITQENLAELCGVSRQAVAKWESGKSIPDVLSLKELAKLFNVSVEYLLNDEETVESDGDNTLDYYRIVNMALHEALTCSNPNDSINKLLDCLGKNFCADRCYIFETNNNKRCVCNTYEWCASGVIPQIDNLQEISIEGYSVWVNSFNRNGNIVIRNIENIKDTTPKIYDLLKSQKINSLIAYPLFNGNGFFGVDNPPLTSFEKINDIFEMIAHYLECFLKQRDSFNELSLERNKMLQWDHFSGLVRYTYNIDTDCFYNFEAIASLLGYEDLQNINNLADLTYFLESHEECKDIILKEGYEKVLEIKDSIVLKIPFIKKDKTLAWFEISFCPLLDRLKNVVQIFGTVKDITKEQEIMEINKALTTYVPGGVHMCHMSEPIHLLYASDGLCAMAGYSREEFEALVGDDYARIILDEDKEIFEMYAVNASKIIGSIDCRYRILTKSGDIITVLETMEVRKHPDGISYGYANVIDITELEKGIKESAQKRKEMEDFFYKDRLTGFGNNRALYNKLEALTDYENLGVLVCRINHLDCIVGDKDSTVEDKNIIDLKKLLCLSFSEDFIFRVDGDEFIVTISGVDTDILQRRMENFSADKDVLKLAFCGFAFGKVKDYKKVIEAAEKNIQQSINNYLDTYLY